jgi:phosphoribosylaminoimidazolecarboxamide formyltransferase/IMP cyclohydrolase
MRALLSVSDKTNLIPFAQFLAKQGFELLSTGGTAKALREASVTVTDVSAVSGFPEIMDGRVKTLHPKIHGGILADRDVPAHLEAMQTHGIEGIDIVVLNLYPFEATVAKGAEYTEAVEQIDIGGPAMLRASAKNHKHVTIVTDPADYEKVMAEITANGGKTTFALRQQLAQKAFAKTSAYDGAIAAWLNQESRIENQEYPQTLTVTAQLANTLRYGENPHQSSALYLTTPQKGTLASAKQLQGKELSYNNLNDTDAAWALVNEFETPAVAIIKHANPCGVALGNTCTEAYTKALACDPVSAYGGIIALNRPLTADFVEALGKLFAEVIIAPEVTPEAAALLAKKPNLRVLETGGLLPPMPSAQSLKPISGGLLVQSADDKRITPTDLKTASATQASDAQIADMLFAFRVAKHVKSNAIVIAKDGATIGIGAGQMSRVDSVRIACWKAAEAGLSTQSCVLASDAFFPFDDNVHRAAEAGITALIQPGGSIRDEDIIKAADQHQMAMVFTGVRHFRH